jgi:TonB family protein
MNEDKRTRLISLGVTLLLHLVVLLLLLWITLPHVEAEEESGVLLMVGLVDESTGSEVPEGAPMQQPEADAAEETTAEATPAAAAPVPTPAPSAPEEPMIAQNDEPAPAIASDAKKKKEETKPKQPTQAELQRQAEAKRQAQQQAEEAKRQAEEAREKAAAEAKRKAEEERKRQAAAAANKLVAGALGKSGQGGTAANAGTGSSGSGAQGSPNGNSSSGASNGTPGWGSYDLGGRGLRGGLPKPTFNVNASGTVVVSITVDASGSVTAATVSPRGTTTSDASLRSAAIKAAQTAKFEPKSDAAVQYGTITYRFDSDN